MPKINGNTVTIATLLTVVVSVLAGYIWMDDRFDFLEMAIHDTQVGQTVWAFELGKANPELVIPDPRSLHK